METLDQNKNKNKNSDIKFETNILFKNEESNKNQKW